MVRRKVDGGVDCSAGADLRGVLKLLVLPRDVPGDDGAGEDARRGEGDAADGRSRLNVGPSQQVAIDVVFGMFAIKACRPPTDTQFPRFGHA